MDRKDNSKTPVCLIILGMAASGKTTFVRNLEKYFSENDLPRYIVNLDPAVYQIPYTANIDIRNTIKYKDIMHKFNLGPNGGIMTCLNLFSTKFHQVIDIIHSKKDQKYIIFDTPGQIEIFTWSASGKIICETLASSFPTIIVYIMDTCAVQNPVTFMSNMIYACSILYKMKLPFILVLNKVDIANPNLAIEWIKDFESFQRAIENDETYSANLMRSLSLVLDEFYSVINTVKISSLNGFGNESFLEAINIAKTEYENNYKAYYEKKDIKALQSHQIDIELPLSTNDIAIIKDLKIDE